jgi:hypothetical protein
MATAAKESSQVSRARRKIKQMLAEEQSKVTPEAIQESALVIRNWIERHSEERIPLKNKNIAVSPSDIKSKYVVHLMQRLSHSPSVPAKRKSSLGSRVKMGST